MTLDEALARIAELEAEKSTLEATITDKDTKIADMEAHAAEKGEQFKKLRDMTAAEKELLSAKELELLKRQEQIEEMAKQTQEAQKTFLQTQREGTLKNIIAKHAKGDEKLAEKIAFNLSQLKGAEEAMDEATLTPFVNNAFNMLGAELTNSLRQNHNDTTHFGNGSGQEDKGFADSPQGVQLGEMLFGKSEEGNK